MLTRREILKQSQSGFCLLTVADPWVRPYRRMRQAVVVSCPEEYLDLPKVIRNQLQRYHKGSLPTIRAPSSPQFEATHRRV